MYTLLKPIHVRQKLLEKGIYFFTPLDFGCIFQIPSNKTKRFLEKWTKEGFLVRFKQGLYGIKDDLPGEEVIANRLYQPSYLSFEYALAFHNVLPEMSYEITSATAKATRYFAFNTRSFAYFTIKQEAFTGFTLIKSGTKSFYMADPEKAFVDYLYFVALGKKSVYERLNITNLNKKKILSYAKLFKYPKLDKLIKEYI